MFRKLVRVITLVFVIAVVLAIAPLATAGEESCDTRVNNNFEKLLESCRGGLRPAQCRAMQGKRGHGEAQASGDHGGETEGGGRLYVVATPIGNLADVTLRALETLRAVDTVFAEDTRHAAGLLAHHGIRARLAALHEHNEREAARAVCRLLAAGKDVAP